jgi:hypothetical protein
MFASQDGIEAWLNCMLLVWSIAIIYVNLFSGPWIVDGEEE